MGESFSVIDDYDDEIGIKDNIVGDVIALNVKNVNSIGFVNECVFRLNSLSKECANRKMITNLLEGFLLDKGYTYDDLKEWVHERKWVHEKR